MSRGEGEFAIARARADDGNLREVWTVLTELRTQLAFDDFRRLLRVAPVVYEAAMDGNSCMAVIGWRFHTDSRIGRHVYVADLVVAAGHRCRNLGRAMVDHVADQARRLNCTTVVLDSGSTNTNAHRFYEAIGFSATAVHFELSLDS